MRRRIDHAEDIRACLARLDALSRDYWDALGEPHRDGYIERLDRGEPIIIASCQLDVHRIPALNAPLRVFPDGSIEVLR